ncbi:MAG TPA: chaplin family protein [Streptomyces sp.]|uniref:chaplin n=1 Tax=Streptomyces sp. TaxID=1931 RepID=UPI002C9E8D33|nr:chaplin family protein [Streptomyces sp.]HWU06601.1 chaplin family protein [Streptomyces sp.]
MRQALSRSVFVLAAASGILTSVGGYAYADATAEGAAVGSPGVGSGNAVQAPVHVPVNLCGNTVDVIALLNPAFGNICANTGSSDKKDDAYGGEGAYGDGEEAYGASEASGASAEAQAVGSPGVLSGNVAQAPVEVPANVCGNTVDVVGLLNPAGGNTCVNESGYEHELPPVKPPVVEPPTEEPPAVEPPTSKPPVSEPPAQEPPASEPPAGDPGPNTPDTPLAETGAGEIGMAAGASAALLLGGAVLMRRTRGSRN